MSAHRPDRGGDGLTSTGGGSGGHASPQSSKNVSNRAFACRGLLGRVISATH
jgi:hypothetical protein